MRKDANSTYMSSNLADLPRSLERRYEPRRALGHGGMGTVVAVHDRLLDREVALKHVTVGHAAAPHLRNELAVLRSIDHPGVVHVHDAGGSDEALYYTMDLVDGPRLDRWLLSGPPDAQVAAVLAQLLETLGWLHRERLVHGDVKPQNIMLARLGAGDRTPWPVLIDFGLARPATTASAGGTRRYLAPELLVPNAPATPRSDLFALGRCFESWARGPSEAGGLVAAAHVLVESLLQVDPQDRPADGLDARSRLPLPAPRPRFRTARGTERLLGDALLSRVVAGVLTGRGQAVTLGSDDEATAFLTLVQARIESEATHGVLLVPSPAPTDAPLTTWRRLLACIAPLAAQPFELPKGPDGLRDALEALAYRSLTTLREAGRVPVVLVPRFSALPWPDRHVLTRAIEAGALPGVVLAGGAELVADLGPLHAQLDLSEASAPTAEAVRDWLAIVHVDPTPGAEVEAVLQQRAAAGPWALAAVLDSLLDAGALVPFQNGFTWVEGVDIVGIDAPALDGLWERLLRATSADDRGVLETLALLGGAAEHADLELALDSTPRAALVRLASAGLVTLSGAADGATIAPGLLRRLGTPTLPSERLRLIVRALERMTPTAVRQEHLGHALAVLGETALAAQALSAAATANEQAYHPALAGVLYAEAAALLAADKGQARAAMDLAERALRCADVAGDVTTLEAALELVRSTASRIGTADVALRRAVVEGRAALHRGRYDEVQAIVRDAERLSALVVAPERLQLELNLLRGTSLAQIGSLREAAEGLERAARLAERLGDLHALGKVANNLGNLWIQNGDLEAAEAAYARAVEAKRKTGDRRGERIAESNRALAERAGLRLAASLERALAAKALATDLGDRRGQATSSMAALLVWLDVGLTTPAAALHAGLAAIATTSDAVRVDATLCTARLAMAEGRTADALSAIEAALALADARGLEPARREALWLAAAARPRTEDAPRLARLAEILSTLPTDAPDVERVPLLAARAALAAAAGELGEAREALDAALSGLPTVLWAGCERVVVLLSEAAACLGDAVARARVAACAERTLSLRIDARSELLARGLVSSEALPSPTAAARAMGLEPGLGSTSESARSLLGPVSAPESHDPEGEEVIAALARHETTPSASTPSPTWGSASAARAAVHRLVDAAAASPAAGFDRWADALRQVSAAEAVWLIGVGLAAPAGPETRVLARVGGDVADTSRFGDLAGRVAERRSPYIGRGAGGTLELFGTRLVDAAVGDATIVALVRFRGTPPEAPEAFARRIEAALGIIALAADARLHRELAGEFRAALDTARTEHARAMESHHDEVTALRDALEQSRTESELRYTYDRIVHRSTGMRGVLRAIDKVADKDISVLVLGESGVG